MSFYVIAYMAVLLLSGAVSYNMGEDRDRITWAVLAVAAVLSHYSLTLGITTAVALHSVAYMFMAVSSFVLATRVHGDIIGITFAGASAMGWLALGGVLPYTSGQGLSWNFWNLHTLCFYAANAALIMGVWRRYNAVR